MKKAFYIFAAVSAIVLAAACAKEQQPEQVTPIEPQEEELVTYTFTASAQSEVVEDGDEEVRSTLSNVGAFTWAVDDQFKIWNTSTNSYVTFSVTEINGDGTVHISGTAAAGAVWGNAIYPASRAAGSGDTVDYTSTTTAGPILVGRVDGQVVYFYYLGAVMNITVNSVPDTPVSLTVTANSNVFGSRTFSWEEDKPVLGGSGSQASVTVPFNASGITSVPVPNVSYAGFTITVDNAAGRHLYKKTTANTFDLTSKKLLPMPALTYAAPGYYLTTTSSGSGYNVSKLPMIQTGANTYELVINSHVTTTYGVTDDYNDSAFATGTTSYTKQDSDWKLYGYINGVDTWSNAGNGPVMVKITDNLSYYYLNATGKSYYRFYKAQAGGDIYLGPADADSDWWTYSPQVFNVNQNFNNRCLFVDPGGYDLILDPSDGKLYVWDHASYTDGDARISYVYNSSTNVITATVINGPTHPWGTTTAYNSLAIAGSFNSWADEDFTYNGNHLWTANLEISSVATYEFKIKIQDDDDWTIFWGSNGNDASYHALDSNLYGSVVYGGNNASVTLSPGSYKVYLSDIQPTYNNKPLNIMFVKQ